MLALDEGEEDGRRKFVNAVGTLQRVVDIDQHVGHLVLFINPMPQGHNGANEGAPTMWRVLISVNAPASVIRRSGVLLLSRGRSEGRVDRYI
jgi:hypothetical protein